MFGRADKKKDVLDHKYMANLTAMERESEYKKAAEAKWQQLLEIFEDDANWKLDKGTDLSTGMVYSKQYKNIGRISKLKCHIDISTEALVDILIKQTESAPSWDPTLIESKIIERYEENFDIHYLVTREIAGGIVARRDYVNIRLLKEVDGKTISIGCASTHPDKPPGKNPVRGKSKAMGMCFTQVPDNPDQCLLQWVMNIDIGGWIPQWTVDQGLASSMLDSIAHIKNKAKQVKLAS